uniref:Cell adhesion molecule L1-like b n=1 Tax=Cyclopterus lumpus TaxID=8103 RepID=A0A8C2XGS9_CYCLU
MGLTGFYDKRQIQNSCISLLPETLSPMLTFNTFMCLHITVEQPPAIITRTSGPIIALPFDNTITIRCKARGNPPPEYRWTKDGEEFVPPYIMTDHTDGTFVLHNKHLVTFQGKYRCYASNKLGTSMTEEIELRVPSVPKFPKEFNVPIVVKEGEPITLECNPPEGVAPRQIYWMSIGLKHIEQDERVSMGADGNLYFSNALQKDSRQDYCCFVAFTKIRTIVQKTAMAVVVTNLKHGNESADGAKAPSVRIPGLLLPSGVQTEKVLLMGENLQLECIPQGYPTPTITWMKMGDKLPLRTQFLNFGKLLSISSVDESDGGKYMCKAQNSAGEAVHYIDVIVEDRPKWETGPPQGQLTVIGTDVQIKCSVSGKPTPDITWRRNGELFSGDKRVFDDTVVLHNAQAEDSAIYQCEASNRHGSVLANINIMVMNMAPRILTIDFQEYAVVVGRDIVINCSVFGSPPPTISWAKDETLEPIGGERFFSLNGSLQIISAEKNDSGKYVCVASNKEGKSAVTAVLDVKGISFAQMIPFSNVSVCFARLGVEEHYFFLHSFICTEHLMLYVFCVSDVPDAPRNVEISEMKSPRNVHLSWIPGSDHNSSVTEFIVEYEESQWEPGRWKELQKVPGNQATAELALQGYLNYQFRVYAVNVVGPGPPSEPTERYKTPPVAPERNPENIKIQGHRPHQMDISWEALLPIEHNGPGLEYKVSYRKLGVEDVWKEHLVKRQSFDVKNTSTYVPYEIKIQSRNSHGWGPDPKVVTGYSGEDVPTAAPRDIAVEVINTTVLRVSWTPAPPATVRGHLGGYDVHWLRKRSWLNPNKILDERRSLSFPGKRTHAIVPGLEPFSEYRLTVNVFNKKGNGPNSDPVTFNTPEGVPEQVPILTASNAQRDSILLVWGPPLEKNGVLTGYLLQHHLINETTLEVVDSQETNITGADTTQWQLHGLEEGSLYRFHLRACTGAGCGPPMVQESSTVNPARDGNWLVSEAVNASRSFHVIDGLKPGTVYTVRLMTKRLLDNASIFEGVIQTRVKGERRTTVYNFSTQGWFIGTLCAVALLTLVVLMACFVRKQRGGKYAVKEKEDLHPDVESQRMNDDTFCEYSDSEEKPLKGSSLCSLTGDDALGDSVSRDSMVDYADSEGEFNEDGSFIGEYSARTHGGSVSEPRTFTLRPY